FPTYKNLSQHDAEWRHTNVRTVIKEIWLVEPSIFNNLGAKQAKVMISLLDKLLVSNENDSLLEVLESVVELDEHRLHQLAEQLNKTTLENIVSTIEVLQRRETVVRKLEELMINNYKDVLETPHLQGIIEANTWLFGEQYSMIGAEEDDFQKTAHNLRQHIKEIDVLAEDDFEQQDLDDGLTIEGVRRQVDLFLARKTKQF
ncbi:ATP-binding protein, partial [Vibrio anguillarum]|nr:ATP-binding protein [Vibrio anguillarum]